MGVLCVILIATIACINFARYRDPLYPPVVHATLWGSILAAYELADPWMVELTTSAYLIVTVGVITFSAGCYLATFRVRSGSMTSALQGRSPNRVTAAVLMLASFVGLVWFVLRARAIASEGPFDSFLINIRYVTGGNTFTGEDALEGFGLAGYFVSLSVISMAIQFFLVEEYGSRWRYYLSILMAASFAVLSTGRTFIMIVVIVILGLNLATGKLSAKRGLGYLVIAGLVSFGVMGLALRSATDAPLALLVDQFRLYLLGGVAAFGQYVDSVKELDWGTNIFRTPALVLGKLGIHVEVPTLTKEYRYVPDPTNVYTFYRPYFDDFGYVGVVLAPFIFGVFYGKVYRLARAGSRVFILCFALSLYPLFMQFFQDQYFTLLSTWVQYSAWIAFGFLGARVIRREYREPEPAGLPA